MAKQPLSTTSEVIEALGGATAVAALTGRKLTAVSNWHKFEHFPANTYLTLITALHYRGWHAPAWLWSMEPRPDGGQPPDAARASIEVA